MPSRRSCSGLLPPQLRAARRGLLKTDYLFMGEEGYRKASELVTLTATVTAGSGNVRQGPEQSAPLVRLVPPHTYLKPICFFASATTFWRIEEIDASIGSILTAVFQ